MVRTDHQRLVYSGVSPISLCRLHREILVDGKTNNRVARDDGRPDLRREVYEFWPPDMLELFRKAGLPRRSPPDPENGTDTLSGLDHGNDPRVVSPLSGRVYQIGDALEDSDPTQSPGRFWRPKALLVLW